MTQTLVTRDNIFAGTYPVVRDEVTVTASQTLARGAVVGIITVGGEAKLLDTASADGSENFYGVLLDPVTTGVGETQVAPVALSGEFQTQALSFGGATTAADVKEDARGKNCYFKTTAATNNAVGD